MSQHAQLASAGRQYVYVCVSKAKTVCGEMEGERVSATPSSERSSDLHVRVTYTLADVYFCYTVVLQCVLD